MKRLLMALCLLGVAWAEPKTLFLSPNQWVESKEARARVRMLKIDANKAVLEVSVGGKTSSGHYAAGQRVPAGDWVLWVHSLEPRRKVPLVLKPRLAPPADRAVDFLQGFGWHVQPGVKSFPDQLPARLNGLPWFHYQAASERLGMDLGLAAGQKITILRYALTEKTRERYNVNAFLATYSGRIVGGWLACDGPVAPGIFPLNTEEIR